jgi:hypothetical protein
MFTLYRNYRQNNAYKTPSASFNQCDPLNLNLMHAHTNVHINPLATSMLPLRFKQTKAGKEINRME